MAHDFGKITATKTPSDMPGYYNVSFTVENDPTDRGICASIELTPTLADRMMAAIEAGKAVTLLGIRTDTEGKTYIRTRWNTMGRWASSDLKKWGF